MRTVNQLFSHFTVMVPPCCRAAACTPRTSLFSAFLYGLHIPADNSWKPVYVDGQKNVIHIDNTDEHGVGLGFGYDYQRVKFICRVFIPVGEKIETVENYVGFRI